MCPILGAGVPHVLRAPGVVPLAQAVQVLGLDPALKPELAGPGPVVNARGLDTLLVHVVAGGRACQAEVVSGLAGRERSHSHHGEHTRKVEPT